MPRNTIATAAATASAKAPSHEGLSRNRYTARGYPPSRCRWRPPGRVRSSGPQRADRTKGAAKPDRNERTAQKGPRSRIATSGPPETGREAGPQRADRANRAAGDIAGEPLMTAQPRLVVSAPSSGHGKTAIAVGVLAACVARGIPAAGFKVGPDHTDAAYLGLAAARPGRNLDPRLVGAQNVAPLFGYGAAGSQIAVIEGAMGLFDSLTGQPEIDGTAAVAAALRAPVALVVDVASMGHSLAA